MVAEAAGGAQAGSTVTDASGHFVLMLPPGGYTFVVDTGGTFPRCPTTPVTVTPGPPEQVDISCDTGIR